MTVTLTDRPTRSMNDLKSPPLPAPWPEDLLPEITRAVARRPEKVVVLDDDPTGTQTVHGIPVLTQWSLSDLVDALKSPQPAFYLLTNSRSLTADQAAAMHHEIGANLVDAARQVDIGIDVISRSDSTLRGHYPSEVDALAQAMGCERLPRIIVPCFFEGGRYTMDDVHYVAEGGALVPAGKTAYAQDAAFGYRHSDLRRWVQEKTSGAVDWRTVVSVGIDDLRREGPGRVTKTLIRLAPGAVCIVNAVDYRDLEVFVRAMMDARDAGHRFVCRTAASFVRVRCGIAPRDLLAADELVASSASGGLFVVGSYVPKTTQQINALVQRGGLETVEVDVEYLLRADRCSTVVADAAAAVNRAIAAGRDVLLVTSRKLVKTETAAGSLDIGRRVSDSLIAIVRGLSRQPRYLVAKGGITSSDVATRGLEVKKAMVLGQILPGVPVWRLGPETRYPGMAYIVFPGNVGSDDALAAIKAKLAG